MVKKNSRDLVGYGSKGKKISWPNNAKIALQIVLNYEEGGENSPLNGDKYSETFLSEIIGAKAIKGRHISMESIYEYGSRAGFWRLDKLFREKKIPVTIFGVGLALEQNPDLDPYSYILSILICLPLIALAPIISDKKVSEYLSPFNTVFSPPSS